MESSGAPFILSDQHELGWTAFDQLRNYSQVYQDNENRNGISMQSISGQERLQNRLETVVGTESADQLVSSTGFAGVELHYKAARA